MSLPQRKSPRLPGYDYAAAGMYFVTICTHQRQHLFGAVHDGEMVLSAAGEIAHRELFRIPDYWRGRVTVDCGVVMPNHVHVILAIATPDAVTLGKIVNGYKGGTTRHIRQANENAEQIVWQSRYHDHIIRDEAGLNQIRQYVTQNPALWQQDTFYE